MATAQTTSPPAASLRPQLAAGVELVGEYRDSGFKTPPWILRRPDGQVVQVPRLLYVIAESADGRRALPEIAERVSHAVRRGVDAEMVGMLVEERLRPLGVLAGADGSSPRVEKLDPLLGLKFKTAVVPEGLTRALTTLFLPLFARPVVALVTVALVALDVWLLAIHGISPGLRSVIYSPVLLLLLLAGVVAATAFHEIGHATACRYGGARPGVMGVGIYIVWPAFYTDVTDAYRLGRGGRLRTDLGGVYFNAIFALAMAGLYAATRFEPLLLLVLIQNFAILQQLLPLVRLDGYYIISDLTGVPDMFSRIRPVLTSVLPGRAPSDRVTELKPWVRRVVTSYILLVVPLLALSFVLMVLHAPRAFATAYDSLGVQWDKLAGARDVAGRAVGGIQLLMLVLPCAGMVLTGGRVGSRLTGAAWSWSAGDPLRRAAVTAVVGGAAGLAAFTWWPNGDYRPIQPGEKGTIQGALSSIADIPSGRPSLSSARADELGGAPAERDVRRKRAERNAAARGDRPSGERPASGDGTDAGAPADGTGDEPGASPAAGAEPSATPTATSTPTPAPAGTPAPASGTAPAATPTPTPAGTSSPSATATPSATPTPTATPNASGTAPAGAEPLATAGVTPTTSATPTTSVTPTTRTPTQP